MSQVRTKLSLAERRFIVEEFVKTNNKSQVRRAWTERFGTTPPTNATVCRIIEKWNTKNTIENQMKGVCGRKKDQQSRVAVANYLKGGGWFRGNGDDEDDRDSNDENNADDGDDGEEDQGGDAGGVSPDEDVQENDDEEGGKGVKPSQREISKATGVPLSTVFTILKEMNWRA